MSMDVSRLGIEVTSTGIKEASTALSGLSRSAGTANKRVESLTANMGKLFQAGGNVTGVISGLSGTMALINSAMQTATANASAMAQALGQVSQNMNGLSSATRLSSGAFQEHSKWGGVVNSTLKAMTTAALAYFGVNFVKHSIEAADSWTQMAAKLQIATGSMNNAKVAQQDLFEMAQKLRVPMDDSIRLFTRLAPIMRQNGQSYESTKNMVEALGLALKLGGATAAESASVMLQFSQAMQKGKLDGQEFNAVASNGKLVMDALAAATGKTQAELATLRSKGFITPEIMMKALNDALPKWQEQFKLLPVTVEDAMTRIKNAWTKAMGELSADTGMNAGLAKSLGVIESLIPAVRDELVKAFTTVATWINDNRNNLGEIWLEVKGITNDAFRMAGAFGMATGQVVGMGDGFSVIGLILFSWRLAIAHIENGFSAILAIILKLGSYLVDYLVTPISNILAGAVKIVTEGFAGLMELMARGASAAHMDTLADSLKGAAEWGHNLSGTLTVMQKSAIGLGAEMRKGSDYLLDNLTNGKDAVSEMLNDQQQINLTVQARPKLDQAAWGKDGHFHKAIDPKIQKEHEKAVKAANVELNKQVDAYKELAAQADQIATFGLSWDKLSKSEKDVIVLTDLLGRTTDKTARGILQTAINTAEVNAQMDRANTLKTDALKAEEAYGKKQNASIDSAQKELDAVNAKIAGYGQLAGSVDDAALAEARLVMAQQGDSMTDSQVKKQLELIATLEKVRDAKLVLAGMENSDKIDKFFDDAKVADFGNGFADAFGKAGKAIDKVGKSLDAHKKRVADNARDQKRITEEAQTDSLKAAYDQDRLDKKQRSDNLDFYADMAGAVKGFFKEKTVAYKVFDAFEKGIRFAQMALTMEEMLVKVAANETVLASKATTTTAGMALTATETGFTITSALAQAGAWLSAGVAHAFAQLGVGGFVVAGAMIALLASLGFGGGGASAPAFSLQDRQAKNGTGTVLGDDTAKSQSLSRSLEALKDNSNVGLTYSSQMAASLRSIDTKMGGLTASIAGVKGLTAGTNFGIQTGTNSHGGLAGLFGGKTTTSIQDSGLLLSGALSSLMGGSGIQQYVDTESTSKSFFGKTKTTHNRSLGGVDDQMAAYIGSIFTDINKTIVDAGASLGQNTSDIETKLKAFTVQTEVSLKDLKGDDLEAALQAMFSSTADSMAQEVAPQFAAFQKAGEGYFETLVRVSTGVEQAKNALAGLGVTMVALNDVTNKTGNVDVELVRDSLLRKEAGTSLEKILGLLDGSMTDLIQQYRDLVRVRDNMQQTGLGSNLSLDLIRGAGGISELSDAFNDYLSGFFTEAQQNQIKVANLRKEFQRLNLVMPTSKDGFKSLVASLITAGPAGEELAGRVLALSNSFTEAVSASDDALKSKISDAKDALKTAYDNEASALENVRDKMKGFSDSLKEFHDTLVMGDLSPLNAMEKYQNALATYNDVSKRAEAGDQDAIGQFTKVAQDLLTNSRTINASGAGYTADYDRVLAETQALQQFTDLQKDAAQQQLDLLTQQVSALVELKDSVLTVAQAIAALMSLPAIGGTAETTATVSTGALSTLTADAPLTTAPSVDTTAAVQAAQAQQANDALIAEVQALRAEVTALREGQAKQTDAIVTATYDANELNAETIVENKLKTAADSLYSQRSGIGFN